MVRKALLDSVVVRGLAVNYLDDYGCLILAWPIRVLAGMLPRPISTRFRANFPLLLLSTLSL